MHHQLSDLGNKTGVELVLAFGAIPATVTSLDLSRNALGNQTGEDLVLAFAAIPATVAALELSVNNFINKTDKELALAFKAITATVTSLNLSGNYLGNQTRVDLAPVFAAIPATVTMLNLSWNFLGYRTAEDLALAFKAIKATVTTLDLASNHLGNIKGEDLVLALAAIPATVTTLNLSRNNLDNKTGKELALAFAAIPATVTRLDLSENNLEEKTNIELHTLLSAIPKTVTHIKLNNNRLFTNRTGAERDNLLAKLEPIDKNELTLVGQNALLPIELNGRLDLARNGESAFSRAIAPFVSAIRQGLLRDIGVLILSYLLPINTKMDVPKLISGLLLPKKKKASILPESFLEIDERPESPELVCKISSVIQVINQQQTKERKQRVLIRFIHNNELSVNEYKMLYDAVKQIEGLNSHRNPLFDSVLGIKNTDSYQNMLGQLRERAFETLFKEVATQTTNNEKLELLADAKASPLFEEHRYNSIFAGAWGRTASQKQIEEQEEILGSATRNER